MKLASKRNYAKGSKSLMKPAPYCRYKKMSDALRKVLSKMRESGALHGQTARRPDRTMKHGGGRPPEEKGEGAE